MNTNNIIRDRLDEIDLEYPNIFHMPPSTRKEYADLSTQLVSCVWQARLADHGSIHSHLLPGEKDGQ